MAGAYAPTDMFPREGKSLEKHFSNRSRKAVKVGSRLLVPKPFDKGIAPEVGAPVPIWNFSLKEARFLKALQTLQDFDKAVEQVGCTTFWAKKFLKAKRANDFVQESNHQSVLATVADPTWIKAKYVSAILGEDKPDETQQWALDKLAAIAIPKQLANLKIETNIFQMPKLTPELQAQLQDFADKAADIQDAEVA